jgi:hypothetical protein
MAKNIAAGIMLLVLAVAYWMGAQAILISRLSGGAGAQLLPKSLAIALGVLSLVLIAQSLPWRRANANAGADDGSGASGPSEYNVPRALGILAIGIAYVVLIDWLGYAVCIALLLGGTAYYIGWRRWRSLVLFALVGALVYWAVFAKLLDLPLPAGLWPALWPAS